MTYEQLMRHYSTQTEAGEALKIFDGKGVAQSTVAEWKKYGIPPARQAQYELLHPRKLKADRKAA